MNQYPAPNPYAAPQAQVMPAGYAPGMSPARVEGQLLVVANGSTFPAVCMKCGANQNIQWRDQKYTYIPPWARFFGWLIQMLVAKRSRFQIPLCQQHHAEWKKWNLIAGLSWVPGVLFWGLGGICSAADLPSVAAVMFLLGTLVFLGGLITALILRSKRLVWASKIDKTHSWLRGVHPIALQAVTTPQPAYYAPQQQGGYPQQMAQGYPQQGGYGYPPS